MSEETPETPVALETPAAEAPKPAAEATVAAAEKAAKPKAAKKGKEKKVEESAPAAPVSFNLDDPIEPPKIVKAKGAFLHNLGILPDIWIDDNPRFITQDAK
jgi:hypothetical protein